MHGSYAMALHKSVAILFGTCQACVQNHMFNLLRLIMAKIKVLVAVQLLMLLINLFSLTDFSVLFAYLVPIVVKLRANRGKNCAF